jgi:hypothetical protein
MQILFSPLRDVVLLCIDIYKGYKKRSARARIVSHGVLVMV